MKEFYLRDLLKIKNGTDHKHLSSGNIPVFGSGGIMRYGDQALYQEESILLPRKGTLSNIQFSRVPFWTVDTIYYTEIKNAIANPYYLYNYLRTLNLEKLNSGTGVPSMTFDSYYSIKIKLPTIDIQNKISHVLSSIENKIKLNDTINDNLERLAKAIYEYWFVQFDFPDANGKPYKSSGGEMIWNEELKREIPDGWLVSNILEIGNLLGGGTPKTNESSYWNGDIPFFTPRDYSNSIFVTETIEYITSSGLESCSSRLYPKGTVFITARGTVGKINIAGTNMSMNQSCYAIQPKKDINYYFLYQSCMELVQHLKRKSNGSVFDAIVSNDIKLTSVLIPPAKSIRAYGDKVGNLFEKILINNTENQQLASIRDWVLPLLMNGQITVK